MPWLVSNPQAQMTNFWREVLTEWIIWSFQIQKLSNIFRFPIIVYVGLKTELQLRKWSRNVRKENCLIINGSVWQALSSLLDDNLFFQEKNPFLKVYKSLEWGESYRVGKFSFSQS